MLIAAILSAASHARILRRWQGGEKLILRNVHRTLSCRKVNRLMARARSFGNNANDRRTAHVRISERSDFSCLFTPDVGWFFNLCHKPVFRMPRCVNLPVSFRDKWFRGLSNGFHARICAVSGGRTAAPDASFRAGVAQLVEQRIRNAWVGGSSPSAGTIFPRFSCRRAGSANAFVICASGAGAIRSG